MGSISRVNISYTNFHAILASNEIMLTIKPGEHGSTFGGNPLACEVAMAALEVIIKEGMIENANRLGKIFREEINRFITNSSIARLVRGKGLLNAIVINDDDDGDTAWNICMSMAEKGLLAKPTHGNIIRFAPPLVINDEQLKECLAIITTTLKEFDG